MLHIVTPLYRYELIDNIYLTIPKHSDIVWHIVKTSRREKLTNPFVYTDTRIKLYEVDCADNDMVTKRNVVFNNITDGYFYLLDDDTIFLEELYTVYKEYSSVGFVGMIIGNQIKRTFNAKAKMPSVDPEKTFTDTGMALCHFSVLREVQWAWSGAISRDHFFWSRCFAFFGSDATILVNRLISYHNYYSIEPFVTVRKRRLGLTINYDINNLQLARLYILGWACIRFLNGKEWFLW